MAQEKYMDRWKRIDAELQPGADHFWLTTTEQNQGAPVCDANRRTALRCLCEGTHRIANDAEIAQFHEEQERRAQACAAATARNAGKGTLTLDAATLAELFGTSKGEENGHSHAEVQPARKATKQ